VTKSPAAEFARLAEEVSQLRRTVDGRLAEDPAREKAFEKLYAEMRGYRDNFVAEAERPLLLDLVLLYDSFSWFQQRLLHEEMSQELVEDSFQFLIDELLEVLYRRDVVPMEPHVTFDRTIQRAMRTEAAPDASRDNHVAKVLKRGFVHKGKALRPEEVVVYKWSGSSGGSP
jgi:molecular chaperone GrpE (heat shock protein)